MTREIGVHAIELIVAIHGDGGLQAVTSLLFRATAFLLRYHVAPGTPGSRIPFSPDAGIRFKPGLSHANKRVRCVELSLYA